MDADTLSRAYLPEVNSRIFVREMEEIDHRANLPVSDVRWQQLTHVWAHDPVLKQLGTVIQCAWPETFLCVFDPILICVMSGFFKET